MGDLFAGSAGEPIARHILRSRQGAELPAVLDYDGCRRDLLEASGWHLPPDWAKDGLYKGLCHGTIIVTLS